MGGHHHTKHAASEVYAAWFPENVILNVSSSEALPFHLNLFFTSRFVKKSMHYTLYVVFPPVWSRRSDKWQVCHTSSSLKSCTELERFLTFLTAVNL